MTTSKILIIAGSDSCSGAGAQIDLKTCSKLNCYATTAFSCLTAQNTQKVDKIYNIDPDFIISQIKSILDDIKIDAIKIGMLASQEACDTIFNFFKDKDFKIILDPVMIATSGDSLLEDSALNSLKQLASICHLITPNINEAEILSDQKINNLPNMIIAAEKIYQETKAKNILIKGGHLDLSDNTVHNLLYDKFNQHFWLQSEKYQLVNEIHGTGCALASAISCNIAQGANILNACQDSIDFIANSILSSKQIGKGSYVLF